MLMRLARLMEDFQAGEAGTYRAHIRAGVEAWVASEEEEGGDGGAILVFSGWVDFLLFFPYLFPPLWMLKALAVEVLS